MIRYAKVLNKITDAFISLTVFVALLFHDYLTVYVFFYAIAFSMCYFVIEHICILER